MPEPDAHPPTLRDQADEILEHAHAKRLSDPGRIALLAEAQVLTTRELVDAVTWAHAPTPDERVASPLERHLLDEVAQAHDLADKYAELRAAVVDMVRGAAMNEDGEDVLIGAVAYGRLRALAGGA
jgi:hypothetical protein